MPAKSEYEIFKSEREQNPTAPRFQNRLYKKEIHKFSFLADYYIDEFSIILDEPVNGNDEHSVKEKYIKAIRRTIEKVCTNDRNFQQLFERNNNKGISINDFEKYCLGHWCDYIEKNCIAQDAKLYDEQAVARAIVIYYNNAYKRLSRNRNRSSALSEETYHDLLSDYCEHVAEAELRAYQAGDLGPEPTAENWNGDCTITELRETGFRMMLEAVYNTLFQPFDWEALRYDLTVRNFYSHQAKEVPPTDVMEAEVRLNDYQYYVGESKIRKTKPKTAKASNNTQPSQI